MRAGSRKPRQALVGVIRTPSSTWTEILPDELLVRDGEVLLLERPLSVAGAPGEPLGDLADLAEAGVGADRLSPFAADLEAVVVGGVVAGRGLDAAGRS